MTTSTLSLYIDHRYAHQGPMKARILTVIMRLKCNGRWRVAEPWSYNIIQALASIPDNANRK